MGMSWGTAGMLQGLGQATKEVSQEAQRTMTMKDIEATRQAMEDKRQERNIQAQKELQTSAQTATANLQSSKQQWEEKAPQRAIDVATLPENIQKQSGAETTKERLKLEAETNREPGGLGALKQTQARQATEAKIAELEALAEPTAKIAAKRARAVLVEQMDADKFKAADPAWALAHKKLQAMSKTDKDRLEEKALQFKLDNQKEDRDIAIRKADDATAVAIMHSGDTEIGRLNAELTDRELDFTTASTPAGQRGIERLRQDIAREKAWVQSARNSIAARNKMEVKQPPAPFVNPMSVSPAAPPATPPAAPPARETGMFNTPSMTNIPSNQGYTPIQMQ